MTPETIPAGDEGQAMQTTPAEDETPAETDIAGRTESLFERFYRITELDLRTVAMFMALCGIWLLLYFLTDGLFLTPRNLTNLAVQGSVVAIMATGMVLVIVARHIDLSVGSVLGFSGMLVAWLHVEFFPSVLPNLLPTEGDFGWMLAVILTLLAGVLIGLWHGFWIAYRGVPAFVVTLGGLLVFRALAWLISDGRTVAPLNDNFELIGGGASGAIGEFWSWVVGLAGVGVLILLTLHGRKQRTRYGIAKKPLAAEIAMLLVYATIILGFVLVMNSYTRPRSEIPRGIPIPVLILVGVVLVMSFISSRTKFGRYVYALGGNPEAAELAGINVKRTTTGIFVIMGVLSAVAGIVTAARLQSAGNLMGFMQELFVIAAAVIGGTALAGGIGTIVGSILGALVVFSIINGMVLLQTTSAEQQIALGLVLIIAVWFDVSYTKIKR